MKPLEVNSKEALLQKYISGNISREEMHLLNEYALDDDFLFDALEGLSINESNNEKVISGLQVVHPVDRKLFHFKNIYLIGAAASFALILFATLYLSDAFNASLASTITMNAEEKEIQDRNTEMEEQQAIATQDLTTLSASEKNEGPNDISSAKKIPATEIPEKEKRIVESLTDEIIVQNEKNSTLPRELTINTTPKSKDTSPSLKRTPSSRNNETASADMENSRTLKKITLNDGNTINKSNQKLIFDVIVLENKVLDQSKLKDFIAYLEKNVAIPEAANPALLNGEITLFINASKGLDLPTVDSPALKENQADVLKGQILQFSDNYPWEEEFDPETGNFSLRILFYVKL